MVGAWHARSRVRHQSRSRALQVRCAASGGVHATWDTEQAGGKQAGGAELDTTPPRKRTSRTCSAPTTGAWRRGRVPKPPSTTRGTSEEVTSSIPPASPEGPGMQPRMLPYLETAPSKQALRKQADTHGCSGGGAGLLPHPPQPLGGTLDMSVTDCARQLRQELKEH